MVVIEYLNHGANITGTLHAVQCCVRKQEESSGVAELAKVVLLPRDEARAHKSTVAMAAIQAASFKLMEPSLCSPELAPVRG